MYPGGILSSCSIPRFQAGLINVLEDFPMNRSLIRWIIVALMALCLVLTLSCPYVAGAEGALSPVFTEGGKPTKPEGWVFEKKYPVSYEDSTIKVTFEKLAVPHTLTGPNQGKRVNDEAWIVRIKISDPSQLRAAVAGDTYEGKHQFDAAEIATSKNAVVAMNGDFFKYENDVGYVVRHGELVRDSTSNPRRVFDMLLIDSEGDFHAVYSASTESINAYVEENLTPLGRTVMHTYNIGPVLVVNGEAQDVSQSAAARQGQYQWGYSIQRIALVQTGPLEYAIVEDGMKSKTSGFSMQEFADFIAEKIPDAILAYNLDGGGSTNLTAPRKVTTKKDGTVLLVNERLNRNNDLRPITDIIYFASAED